MRIEFADAVRRALIDRCGDFGALDEEDFALLMASIGEELFTALTPLMKSRHFGEGSFYLYCYFTGWYLGALPLSFRETVAQGIVEGAMEVAREKGGSIGLLEALSVTSESATVSE